MTRSYLLALLAGLAAAGLFLGSARAAPVAQAPTAAFQSVGEFRAAMFLTKDPTAFQEAAKKSLSDMAQASASSVPVGQTIYAALMFGGCKAGVTKTCTVSAVFRITPPKGKLVTSDRVFIWRMAAPDVKSIQLSEFPFAMALAKTDPQGTYAVEVDVLDHNANVTVTLKTNFQATR